MAIYLIHQVLIIAGPFARGLWEISMNNNSQKYVYNELFFPVGWSLDEKSIYAVNDPESPDNNFFRISTSGGKVDTVVTMPGPILSADVDSKGEKFVLSIGESKSDIWLSENFDPEIE